MLHQPHVLVDYEKSGGEDGGMKEKLTNLLEGDPKGGCRSHTLHENRLAEPRLVLRAPVTTTQPSQFFQYMTIIISRKLH